MVCSLFAYIYTFSKCVNHIVRVCGINLRSNIWNSEGDWPGVRARGDRTLEGRDIFAQIKDPTVHKLPVTSCLYHHCQVGCASSHRGHWYNQSMLKLSPDSHAPSSRSGELTQET